MSTIQWYPGHMAKARRMIEENVALVDIIIELLDARAPRASKNPDFDALFSSKKRIIIANKSDLADQKLTQRWLREFERQGALAAAFTATSTSQKQKAIALIEQQSAELVAKKQLRGVQKTVRVMIAGIPNVGKSTFINCIAGGKNAATGNKPGVTKGKQWVKITPYLELLDTPGMLWPKLENQIEARHLACLGTINDDIMDKEALACALLEELGGLCPDALTARYKKLDVQEKGHALLEGVCASRGFLLPGGVYDTERAANAVVDEFRAGKIARVTLEAPSV